MPERRDFSGGYSDLPIELHDESQLLEAKNVYWAQRLKKWGGRVDVTPDVSGNRTPMTGCFHIHSYVRLTDSQAFTFFMRIIDTHVEVWAVHHLPEPNPDNIPQEDPEKVSDAEFWDGAGITTDTEAWSTQVEQGIVIGAAGVWPMVITECSEGEEGCTAAGDFKLKTLDSFDVRERSHFDVTIGFAKNVGDPHPSDDDDLPTVFLKALGPTNQYGTLGDDGQTFVTWENNILWVTSLLTFNRITIEGNNLPSTGHLYLVTDEGEHLHLGDFSPPIFEWDWKAVYAKYNTKADSQFGGGTEGQSQFRAFIWFDGPDPIPLPPAPGGLAASTIGRVTWDEVDIATSYETRYKEEADDDSTYSAWLETTNLFVALTGITDDTEYRIQVRSKSNVGVSATPAQLDFTPTDIVQAPGVPFIRFHEHDIIVERGSGDAPDSFYIEYREGTTGGFTPAIVSGTESATITTAINGVLQAQARAINTGGSSAISNVVERVARPNRPSVTYNRTYNSNPFAVPPDFGNTFDEYIIANYTVTGAIGYQLDRYRNEPDDDFDESLTLITSTSRVLLVQLADDHGSGSLPSLVRVRATGTTGPGPISESANIPGGN